jgi:hypothetical protein
LADLVVSRRPVKPYVLPVTGVDSPIATGSVFSIGGINSISMADQKPMDVVRLFVITADVLEGATELHVYPPMITEGRYKTVSKMPRKGCVIHLFHCVA